jgi:hypothetical protein
MGNEKRPSLDKTELKEKEAEQQQVSAESEIGRASGSSHSVQKPGDAVVDVPKTDDEEDKGGFGAYVVGHPLTLIKCFSFAADRFRTDRARHLSSNCSNFARRSMSCSECVDSLQLVLPVLYVLLPPIHHHRQESPYVVNWLAF